MAKADQIEMNVETVVIVNECQILRQLKTSRAVEHVGAACFVCCSPVPVAFHQFAHSNITRVIFVPLFLPFFFRVSEVLCGLLRYKRFDIYDE